MSAMHPEAKGRISSPVNSIIRPARRLLVPRASGLGVSRRGVLGGLLALPAAFGGAFFTGCAAIAGEETIDAFFTVGKGTDADFDGWSEYNFDEAVDPEQAATLERVMLHAPGGAGDLTFITSVYAEAVQPDKTRTPLAQGSNFPKNDSIAPLDILYDGNLRPLLYPDGKKLRIEWSGTFDTTYPHPEGGTKVQAQVVVEVL